MSPNVCPSCKKPLDAGEPDESSDFCYHCGASFRPSTGAADEPEDAARLGQVADETPPRTPGEPMDYGEWIGVVFKEPFGSGAGQAGPLLVLSMIGIMAVAILLAVKVNVHDALPPGKYPEILLKAPFFIGGFVVFFLLSPIFYRMYVAEHRRKNP